ncbi:MAG: nucleoside phosphorylase [Rhodovarius sp.]|nr:nucleoside phosphorylase [Rhodovarius sp.]
MSGAPGPGLLCIVGFTAEAALLPPGVPVVISAADPARLDALLAAVPRPAAMLSLGLAGALDPGLTPGTVLVADGIAGAEARPDPAWSAAIAAATGARPALLAAVDALCATPAAKAALRAATGAAAVEMESHVVARHAARLGVPYAVLRAVADGAAEGIPPAATAALDAEGRPALGRVLAALLRRPRDVPALIRLARRSRTGLSALAAALPRLPPPPQLRG